MDEPREEQETRVSDKSVPPQAMEARDRLGRELGLLWIGIFAVAAILIALVAWYFA